MNKSRRNLICGFCLFFMVLNPARAAEGPHAGPWFDRFPLTLTPGERKEAGGPFFYSESTQDRNTWAVPPLFSRSWGEAADFDEMDFLYPLATYRRYGTEYRWQLVQLFSFSGGLSPRDSADRRFTLFPVYFQQRSSDPRRNYTAVFPFYGHLKNRLFRDEIFFVMFPGYGRTRKRDVVTDNYLYPIFSLRHGDGLHGWKVWPLAGHEYKVPTTRTNGFGETEVVGGHDDWFVLWPIFFLNRTGIGTDNPAKREAVIPFYSYLRSPQRDSTTVLWPLIAHVTDREKHYREWQTPWPLIIFARGTGKTTSRVWPFYSHAQDTNLESGFVLWPVYKYNRMHGGALDRERTRILFFLYSDKIEKNTETGRYRRRIDLWPLFTRSRDFSGASRLQLFAPLEPFLPNSPSIERDYSPLWSLWRSENNPRTGATSQSLLWNLWRRQTTSRSREWSFLFGLCQYQAGPQGKRLRLFYVPVIKTKPAPPGPESEGKSRNGRSVSPGITLSGQ